MRNLLGSVSILTLGEAGSKVLGFLSVAWMARVLGPAAFGRVSIGLAVLGYLVLVGSPGLHLYGTRAVAGREATDARLVAAISGLRLLLAAVLWAVTLGYAVMAGAGSEGARMILLFALTLFPLALSLDWYVQGRERMGTLTVARLVCSGAILLLLLTLVRGAEDAARVPIAWLAGNAAASGFLLGASIRGGTISPADLFRRGGMRWTGLLRRALPLGLGSGLAQAALHFPPILLALLAGPVVVGRFSAAMRLVLAMMLLDRVTGLVFYPIAARCWREDRARLKEVSARFLRWIAAVTLPIAVVVALSAGPLVALVYGPEYAEAAVLLRILVAFFPLTALNSVFLFGLMGAGREDRYAAVMLRGTLVQVGATALLAVWLGVAGAAIGLVAGELGILLLASREYRGLFRETV